MAGVFSRRGSVLVEGVLTTTLLVMSCALQWEWMRRSWIELLVHHAAFLSVRASLVSAPCDPKATVSAFWKRAIGPKASSRWLRSADAVVGQTSQHRTARVHLRFKSLMSFPLAVGKKRYFEVTRLCRFPYF